MLINYVFYRESVRRNPKVDRIGSLFLVYIISCIKNKYCESQDELGMLNNWMYPAKNQSADSRVGKTVFVCEQNGRSGQVKISFIIKNVVIKIEPATLYPILNGNNLKSLFSNNKFLIV